MNKSDETNHRYDDIISLEAPTSVNHPRMPRLSRAAQFAPFAALSGHDEIIDETARLTDRKIILDENEVFILNNKLNCLLLKIPDNPQITITYFVPDDKKSGGRYVTHTGTVKKIDNIERTLIFIDNTVVAIDDIADINGDIFAG